MNLFQIFQKRGWIIILIGVMLIAAVIVGTLPINKKLNLKETMEVLKESFYEGDTLNEEEIDFGKFRHLEKIAIVNTTDTIVDEVWLVKLLRYSDQEEVARILGKRIDKLKNAFYENPEQLNVIQNAIVKQENGVMIMIISPNSRLIEKQIAEEMSK